MKNSEKYNSFVSTISAALLLVIGWLYTGIDRQLCTAGEHIRGLEIKISAIQAIIESQAGFKISVRIPEKNEDKQAENGG